MKWGLERDTIVTMQTVFTGGGRKSATSFLEIARLLELEWGVTAGMARSNMTSNAFSPFCKAPLAFLVQPLG